MADVTSGVPQGSVLGPLLFLLYVNDVCNVCTEGVTVKLFADDTVIYTEVTSVKDQVKLQTCLGEISSWCHKWQMSINVEKTVSMSVTRKKEKYQFVYSLYGAPLAHVENYKYLGVHICSNLSWNLHLDNVIDKAFKKLCFLKRSLKHATPESKLTAYKTLIIPMIAYASPIWHPHTSTGIARLESIQNKALRFVFHSYRRTASVTALRAKAELNTMNHRFRINRLKLLYSFHRELMLTDKQRYLAPYSGRMLRDKHEETIANLKFRTDCLRFSFFPRTISEWNKLPAEVTSANTPQLFLTRLRNHM